MATTYTYADKYLGPKITEAIETQATTDVAALGDFSGSAYWLEQLIVTRAYCLLAAQSMAESDDLYSAKLAHYEKQMKAALGSAREAVAAAGTTISAGTMSLERR